MLRHVKGVFLTVLITIIPIVIFIDIYFISDFYDVLSNLSIVYSILVYVGVFTVAFLVNMLICPFLARQMFPLCDDASFFAHEMSKSILWNDHLLDNDIKKQVHAKLIVDYGLLLPDRDEERRHFNHIRSQITDIIQVMLDSPSLDYIKEQLELRQLSICMLLGGIPIAFVSSVLIVIYGLMTPDQSYLIVGIALSFIYLMLVMIHTHIVKWHCKRCSKYMFREYLERDMVDEK